MPMRIFTFISLLFLSSYSFAQNISGVVNIYRKVLWVDSSKGEVKLSDVSGFASFNGRKAMIIQMKGAAIDQTNTAAFGSITAINNAGNYEVGTICGFLNDTMVFERKFNNFYDVNSAVQCVIFPKYTGDVTVTDTLKAADWDPVADTGGVIAIDVPGTIYLNKPIDAGAAGFRGGLYTQYGGTCNFNPLSPPTDYSMPYLANAVKTGGYKGEGISFYIAGKEYARGSQANGGGGGNNHNSGGGGGGNMGAGGAGGNRVASAFGECAGTSPGRGGLSLSGFGYAISPASQNKIFLGGGGGAGHDNDGYGMPGGHGGGIIFIIADAINGNSALNTDNTIMADGRPPLRYLGAPFNTWSSASSSDGSGGGGAGGVIILQVNNYKGSTVNIEAKGADGGNSELGANAQCAGPGGGGGGGVIWFDAAADPAGITTQINGGMNGIATSALSTCNNTSNGALPGNAGQVLHSFILAVPADSSPVCKGLVAVDLLLTINGNTQQHKRVITATVNSKENVRACFLQRSVNGNFIDISSTITATGNTYIFSDDYDKTALYRIRLLTKDGLIFYSDVLRFDARPSNSNLSLTIYPDPAREQTSLQVYAATSGICNISIKDAQGRALGTINKVVKKGMNVFPLLLNDLPQGILFIRINDGSNMITGSVINIK
ncbi:MAG: T9SS type A sorting domain-containing protein [Ferruginibacter sp.]